MGRRVGSGGEEVWSVSCVVLRCDGVVVWIEVRDRKSYCGLSKLDVQRRSEPSSVSPGAGS